MAISEFLHGVRERVTVVDEEAQADHLPADPGEFADADVLPEDPPAGRKSTKRAKVGGSPPKASAAQKKSVADALTMMIDMPGAVLSFRDPVCGGAVLAQSDEVVKKLVPIVCRNPKLLEWLTSGAGYMDWFGLFVALTPIVKTVWQHHVVAPRETEGGHEHGGNGPDFSHYTAPDLA